MRHPVPSDTSSVRSEDYARDAFAGVVASFVTLAHCLSFSALVFAGDLSAGLPMALWGFMLASTLVTVMFAARTTLPPILAGPRNPVVAVMAVAAAMIAAAAFEKGLSAEDAARHALLGLSIASALTGLLIWTLGAFRLGRTSLRSSRRRCSRVSRSPWRLPVCSCASGARRSVPGRCPR